MMSIRQLARAQPTALKTFSRAMGIKVSDSVTLPNEKTDQHNHLSSVFDKRPDLVEGAVDMVTNDYIGLAMHPKINEASAQAVLETGGVSWNRTATMPRMPGSPILRMQDQMAKWLGSGATIFMKSGNDANIGLLDLVLSYQPFTCYRDSMTSHPVNMATRFSGVKEVVFRHNDVDHLRQLMKEHGQGIIVTESINGYLGTVAPLEDIVSIAKTTQSGVYVEESHAFGVYGESGQGLVHQLGLAPDVHMRCGDFGNAFGSMGGICAMNKPMADMYHFSATMSIFSREAEDYEALRMMAALDVIPEEKGRIAEVFEKSDHFRNALKDIGFHVPSVSVSTPIIPIVTGNEDTTISVYKTLKDANIFCHPYIPPLTSRNNCFLRFTVTHKVSKDDINKAIEVLKGVYTTHNAEDWPKIENLF